jgi:hypothetical protein
MDSQQADTVARAATRVNMQELATLREEERQVVKEKTSGERREDIGFLPAPSQ